MDKIYKVYLGLYHFDFNLYNLSCYFHSSDPKLKQEL